VSRSHPVTSFTVPRSNPSPHSPLPSHSRAHANSFARAPGPHACTPVMMLAFVLWRAACVCVCGGGGVHAPASLTRRPFFHGALFFPSAPLCVMCVCACVRALPARSLSRFRLQRPQPRLPRSPRRWTTAASRSTTTPSTTPSLSCPRVCGPTPPRAALPVCVRLPCVARVAPGTLHGALRRHRGLRRARSPLASRRAGCTRVGGGVASCSSTSIAHPPHHLRT
jgi:hypothetical protein